MLRFLWWIDRKFVFQLVSKFSRISLFSIDELLKISSPHFIKTAAHGNVVSNTKCLDHLCRVIRFIEFNIAEWKLLAWDSAFNSCPILWEKFSKLPWDWTAIKSSTIKYFVMVGAFYGTPRRANEMYSIPHI